jgi:cytoskeleton protein RodZ
MNDFNAVPAQAGRSVDEPYEMQAQREVVEISAGMLLRQAREASGLHIAALAVALKVPVKKLEAIESDRFIELTDAVFVRALASSICRTLRVDAAPVLQRLPQISSPRLNYRNTGINAPFRSPGDGPGPSVWTRISRPAVLAGLVLLLAAVVLILLPVMRPESLEVNAEPAARDALSRNTISNNESVATDGVLASSGSRSADAAGQAARAIEVFPPGPAPHVDAALSNTPASPYVPVSSTLVLAGSKQLSATPAVLVLPAAIPASAGMLSPAPDILMFSARKQSWVEVTDAKGRVVLRRTLAAGETASASGALPLSAVVGRADETQVQLRGKAFDLSAHAHDNVARFEVK